MVLLTRGLVTIFILGTVVVRTALTQVASGGCARCNANQYCFQGTQVLCVECNSACDGCTGPGAVECIRCGAGYYQLSDTCTGCQAGHFGAGCNGTCHCLDDGACNNVNGECVGKCKKGYYNAPQCQDECPDGNYGIDCLELCHCRNDTVCDKANGNCPNGLCHPDWTGHGCSKRLPKLVTHPEVTLATCYFFTVIWPAWNSDLDFGDTDLPVSEYRLYSQANGSDTWRYEVTLQQDTSITEYQYNVTGLQNDEYYIFRVDVHYSDDGKVQDMASPGPVTDPPVLVPCATTTVPPPVTVPIIVGTEIFDEMTATLQTNNSLLITWSIEPSRRRFSWNITLSYQLIGVGNCQSIADGDVISLSMNQSDTEFRLSGLQPWSRYNVELTAQGLGIVSSANGSESVIVITDEIAPSGNISQIRVVDTQSTSVTLAWASVACAQRGGLLVYYDITVKPYNVSSSTPVLTSNVTSVLVENLIPYTSYVASVSYVNSVGSGPYSEDFLFTTAEGEPAPVTILSLVPTDTTITVKVMPPNPVNGILSEYYILYSDSPTFTLKESLTYNATLVNGLVIRRLNPDTTYYIKVRGRTGAGYGPYGNAGYTRTAQARPDPPSFLSQSFRNLTCITISWLPPNQTLVAIAGYMVTLLEVNTGDGDTQDLDADITNYTRCDLNTGSVYNVSITSRSGAGSGKAASLLVTTEQADPLTPSAPVLVSTNITTATIELEPVVLTQGPLTAYRINVEKISQATASTGRRKRQAVVPGYVTAELSPDKVQEREAFVIGDGLMYEGFLNRPLESGEQYRVHYAVLSMLNGLTKTSFVSMPNPIDIPLPATTTLEQTTAINEASTQPSAEDDDGALIGVIVALILVIIIIILVIIFIIWWRRRQNNLMMPPPYFELDENEKAKPAVIKEVYDPEKYWNQITSLKESRYIVVGRECLPDSQLIPVSTQIPQPDAVKLTFKKEFRSLPHTFQQATTRQAELHADRNRFPHILAYDHSRAELAPDSSSSCPYINANYMSGFRRQRCYIAAQSPYDDRTVVDFWRLIVQHKVKTVVMVANSVEDDIVKCAQFWPLEGKLTMGQFCLELQEEVQYADFTARDISVREHRQQYGHMVRLFDFTSWPHHGVPDDPIPFLDMRYKVRQYHGDEGGPILVHCGTGVARTGVFIAVDSLIEQYAEEGRVSVYSFVRKMRKERPHMVRTLKQYQFIYECLLEEFHAGDTMTDALSIRTKYHDWASRNVKTGHSFLRDQFQLLHRLTRGPEADDCKAAGLPENSQRNRYSDVIPSDLHRPVLRTPAKLSKTDYINAIYVDGYRKQRQFIITQTALHTTLVDFWRLVYDHRVTTIVMMDDYNHADDTCAQYWPDDVIMKQWEPFFVETTAAFQQDNVTIRNLKVKNTLQPQEQPLMVRQFQFNSWAKNSFVPASKTMALDLLEQVLSHHTDVGQADSPIVVHCEDGATHSGLFVSLALICERMEEEQEVDVYHTLKHLKRRRPQIIPDFDQLRFCYKALWDYINLRMPGGTFTDTFGQTKMDTLYGGASLNLSSHYSNSLSSKKDSLY